VRRDGFAFHIGARDGGARRGRLDTPHGVVETPAFMPVATFGAVRGTAPAELRAAGAQMLLANTYHLHERPGEDVVAAVGGLHAFTGWNGAWLTDSGGFQVTSLAHRLSLDEDGVVFQSPIDGRRRALSPERAVEVQQALGSDIAMVLDECRPPADPAAGRADPGVRAAAQRTLRWAARCRRAHTRADQALFGIVQGGTCEAWRRESARGTADLGFDGFAHGGLGLGEQRALRRDLVCAVHEELPEEAPRYLMGLGRPVDLLDGIAAGVDLFDCVLPTRHGRHGVLFTGTGLLRIRNARYRADASPPEPGCPCPACRDHSRAYLRHLLQSGEALGARLASLHNLHFYLSLLAQARRAIESGSLAALRERIERLEGDASD
jgi:queuine tRNA-ribosyltransferase